MLRQAILEKTKTLPCMHSAHDKGIKTTYASEREQEKYWVLDFRDDALAIGNFAPMCHDRACLDFSPGQGILGPKGHVLHPSDACDLMPAQPTMILP